LQILYHHSLSAYDFAHSGPGDPGFSPNQ